MPTWSYDDSVYDPEKVGFQLIPVGDYRVRIESVTEQVSRTGKDMLKIVLEVSGQSGKLFYYLVFDPGNPDMTNRNLGAIYDSFNLPPGNMEYPRWVGKVGAAHVKHEEYNGSDTAKLSYFIPRHKQDDLPAWGSGTRTSSGGSHVARGTIDLSESGGDVDIPF